MLADAFVKQRAIGRRALDRLLKLSIHHFRSKLEREHHLRWLVPLYPPPPLPAKGACGVEDRVDNQLMGES
jgi:hypothetical protein